MNKAVGTTLPQRAANVRQKSSGKNTVDPIAMKKQFGDKNLSDVLNGVADPNFKNNTRKVRGTGNAELGKDAFFKLMLTQLKQQDPTNPLKSHEMAAQLAQFSSVEQLTNMNQTLTKMSQKDGQQGKYDVLSLIGKTVSGDSGSVDRVKGDKQHKIEFNLPSNANKATITVKDDKGMVVKQYDLKDLKKGQNQILWNGMHADGKDARVGHYTASITASSQGRKMPANTQFTGAVTGVQFTAGGPMLMVDGKTLNLRDVKKIEIPKAKTQPSVSQNVLNPNEKVSKGAVAAKKNISNLDTARMDKELRLKLEGRVK